MENRTPSGFAQAAEKAAKEGFSTIKLAPFDEVSASDRQQSGGIAHWQPGIERVRAVRKAVGADVEVAVDCHSRFTLKESVRVAAAFEPLDIFWFEEPISVADLDGLRQIRTAIKQPLATAESPFSLTSFSSLSAAGAADVIMPDVKHAGGDYETLLIGEMAAAHGVEFAPHNPSEPVACLHSGHVCTATNAFRILENAWGEVPWRAEILDPPEQIEYGHLVIPVRPGLGHSLNQRTMRKYWLSSPGATDSSKAVA